MPCLASGQRAAARASAKGGRSCPNGTDSTWAALPSSSFSGPVPSRLPSTQSRKYLASLKTLYPPTTARLHLYRCLFTSLPAKQLIPAISPDLAPNETDRPPSALGARPPRRATDQSRLRPPWVSPRDISGRLARLSTTQGLVLLLSLNLSLGSSTINDTKLLGCEARVSQTTKHDRHITHIIAWLALTFETSNNSMLNSKRHDVLSSSTALLLVSSSYSCRVRPQSAPAEM